MANVSGRATYVNYMLMTYTLQKLKLKTRLGLRLGSNYSHARMLVLCYDEIKEIRLNYRVLLKNEKQ